MRAPRCALALVLAATATAAAAPDKAAAERYFRAGAKAYAAQNFEAAIASFEAAYQAMPAPEIAFSAAQAYRRQYRVDPKPEYVRRSVELYRQYLDHVKTGGRVGDAADSLGEMQRELDRLAAKGVDVRAEAKVVERTRLGVTLAFDDRAQDAAVLREIGDGGDGDGAQGATATLDGAPLAPFALVDVTPGEHVLAVTAPGYAPVTRAYRAVQGASELVEIALHAKPARVAIASEPGTRVVVDGRAAGTLPMGTLELVAGKHVIALLRRGREPRARELVVARGEATTLDVALAPTAQRRAVPWVYAGAGALAVGAGVTLAIALVAQHDASALRAAIAQGDRPPSDADAYDRDVARRDRYATATYALGAAAALAALVATGLYVFDAPSVGDGGVALAPTASGAGVTVHGRF